MSLLKLFFSYQGRINRVQFWCGQIAAFVAMCGATFAVSFSAGIAAVSAGNGPDAVAAFMSTLIFLGPVLLVFSWSAHAINVKRMHDRGRSGYLLLIPMVPSFLAFVGLVNVIVSSAAQREQPDPALLMNAGQPWVMITWLMNLAILIDVGFLPGRDGPNKYGDPPGGGMLANEPRNPGPPPVAPTLNNTAAAATTLSGAQSAIERAIADKARVMPAQAELRVAAPAPNAPLRPAPAAGAPASFGRRVR